MIKKLIVYLFAALGVESSNAWSEYTCEGMRENAKYLNGIGPIAGYDKIVTIF